MRTFIEKLRGLREDNDLKQAEMAEYLHTTRQVYSRYEKGTNEMPLRHLILLARFYGVSLDYIAGETDCRQRYP